MKQPPLMQQLGRPASQGVISVPAGIVDSLREKIFKGELPPGARIVETRLSKDLNVGQPAVREALLILERQGLVQRVANIGTFVRQMSVEEAKNLFRIRRELEGLAAEEAARRATKDDISDLKKLAENIETRDVPAAKDRWKHFQRDLAFHQSVWRLSGNQQLVEFLESVTVPLFQFAFWHHERTAEQLKKSAKLHMAIVEGIENGPAAARAATRRAIDRFVQPYLDRVLSFP